MDIPDYELDDELEQLKKGIRPTMVEEVPGPWKAVAIIFMFLFFALLAINVWGVLTVLDDEAKTDECYYDVCADYSEAKLIEEICYCYEGGDWELAKTTPMND